VEGVDGRQAVTSPVGVGIVGLGFGARVHLPGYRRLEPEGVRVVAVCGRDGAAARRVADEAGVPRAYDDWRTLVADAEVDVVSVAVPPAAHREIVLAALEARKAVLCEKPLAATVAEADELEDAAAAAAVPVLVGFEFRGVPAFRTARELLAANAIGRVLHLDVAWHIPSRLHAPADESWKDSAEAGGGALLAFAVHSLDYVEWLLRPVARLTGWAGSLLGTGSSDDACAALLELDDGTPVTLSISTVATAGQGHVLRFYGDDGSLMVANPELGDHMRSFRLEQNGEPIVVPEPTTEDGRIAPFAELARELVAALREARPAVPSFREGARAQRLAEAVRQSGASHTWLAI
jgi:predicted dehydrogenase